MCEVYNERREEIEAKNPGCDLTALWGDFCAIPEDQPGLTDEIWLPTHEIQGFGLIAMSVSSLHLLLSY